MRGNVPIVKTDELHGSDERIDRDAFLRVRLTSTFHTGGDSGQLLALCYPNPKREPSLLTSATDREVLHS